MLFLYNIFIQLYNLFASVLSLKNEKAKLWVQGRENIFEELSKAFAGNSFKIIWVHCASLGEFEQARPIIEELNKTKPSNYKIFLTFFSPSGYEVQKNYNQVDNIFYLPIDTKNNAEKFIHIVKPSFVIFVKYEFWFHYFTSLKSNNIPLILVSAIFRNNQPFFKCYGSLHKKMLDCVTHFFVQNFESKDLLLTIKSFRNITVAGDTRFDRVLQITNNKKSFADIEQFIKNKKVIVAGSTWTEDDEELDHFANTNTNIKFIIAPHEINTERLNECLSLYKNSVLYSNIKNANNNTNVLIIDNIGMLSSLYAYATISYVGGGFGADGVHNVLEPAVYGKPVVFGEEFDKFIEAKELIACNGAISVENALELEQTLNNVLNNQDLYNEYCNNAKKYVQQKAGATKLVLNYISENLLLTTA